MQRLVDAWPGLLAHITAGYLAGLFTAISVEFPCARVQRLLAGASCRKHMPTADNAQQQQHQLPLVNVAARGDLAATLAPEETCMLKVTIAADGMQ